MHKWWPAIRDGLLMPIHDVQRAANSERAHARLRYHIICSEPFALLCVVSCQKNKNHTPFYKPTGGWIQGFKCEERVLYYMYIYYIVVLIMPMICNA